MITVRAFVRFAFAALFVNALAVACVVEDGDDTSDACDPGSVQTCACDGEEGTKKCNASGSGYGVCVCDSGAGGSGSGGSGSDAGGSPASNGGYDNSGGYAGEATSVGGQAIGGAAGSDGGAAGGDVGGAAGVAGAAGAGGAIAVLPIECTDDADDCETCYHACCEDWVACSDNSECVPQYFDILECINAKKAELGTEPFKPEHLVACADEVAAGTEPWSTVLTPQTVAMVNCLGGDPGDPSWAEMASWGADSCKDLCF